MTSTTAIPESVTGRDLAEAMQPLLDLLGVSLDILMAHGLHIDFADGVTVTCAVPAAAGLAAVSPLQIPGNASSELTATTHIRVTGPGPDLGKLTPTTLVAEVA